MGHKYVTIVNYKCPDCDGVFEVRHYGDDRNPPDNCPLCGSFVGKEKKKRKRKLKEVPSVRALGAGAFGLASKSADSVYRQLETSADARREQAAQMLGVDARSLGAMKVTNMKDNLRAGDMSHIPSPAAKIQGSPVDLRKPDGALLGAGFGSSGEMPIGLPGKPDQAMNNMMSSVFQNHRSVVQATVASGKKN